MISETSLNRCLAYINCGIQPPAARQAQKHGFKAVTISRQSGAGGHAVAEMLLRTLQDQASPNGVPWTIFDRNLVEKVLEDHNLPARLARFMPEDKISQISDTMDELFGLHPPSWNLVRNVAETMLRLIERGNVIIIGRGANVIAANVPAAFHVRLVGSVANRITHLRETHSIGERTARDLLRKEDRARARYLRTYFDQDVENPLLYHITLNTDLISHAEAAELIAGMVSGGKS